MSPLGNRRTSEKRDGNNVTHFFDESNKSTPSLCTLEKADCANDYLDSKCVIGELLSRLCMLSTVLHLCVYICVCVYLSMRSMFTRVVVIHDDSIRRNHNQ